MIKSAHEREEEKDGTTYPIMTLEEQKELSQIFDVKETIQEARIAREKRDMARFGRYGDENCEISPDERHLPNDIPGRGMNDNGRL